MFRFSSEPLDIKKLSDAMESEAAGAVVTFEGRVRNSNEGKAVLKLIYEAYEALAQKEGLRVMAEAREKFAVIDIQCMHRTGELQIGEAAVWVGVLAAHRGPAFEACRFIIDEIKSRVPIWKKEFYADGEINWVNCAECAAHAKHDPHKMASTVGESR